MASQEVAMVGRSLDDVLRDNGYPSIQRFMAVYGLDIRVPEQYHEGMEILRGIREADETLLEIERGDQYPGALTLSQVILDENSHLARCLRGIRRAWRNESQAMEWMFTRFQLSGSAKSALTTAHQLLMLASGTRSWTVAQSHINTALMRRMMSIELLDIDDTRHLLPSDVDRAIRAVIGVDEIEIINWEPSQYEWLMLQMGPHGILVPRTLASFHNWAPAPVPQLAAPRIDIPAPQRPIVHARERVVSQHSEVAPQSLASAESEAVSRAASRVASRIASQAAPARKEVEDRKPTLAELSSQPATTHPISGRLRSSAQAGSMYLAGLAPLRRPSLQPGTDYRQQRQQSQLQVAVMQRRSEQKQRRAAKQLARRTASGLSAAPRTSLAAPHASLPPAPTAPTQVAGSPRRIYPFSNPPKSSVCDDCHVFFPSKGAFRRHFVPCMQKYHPEAGVMDE